MVSGFARMGISKTGASSYIIMQVNPRRFQQDKTVAVLISANYQKVAARSSFQRPEPLLADAHRSPDALAKSDLLEHQVNPRAHYKLCRENQDIWVHPLNAPVLEGHEGLSSEDTLWLFVLARLR